MENAPEKLWVQVADGIYRNRDSGKLYERPWVKGRRTWRSLQTGNIKTARDELHKRRSGLQPEKEKVETVGDVLKRYRFDYYPDKHRKKRPPAQYANEEKNCSILKKYWSSIKLSAVTLGECDRYHDYRCREITTGPKAKKRPDHHTGHRTVDIELTTLSNAFAWGVRSEIIKYNPIGERNRYCTEEEIHHCREYAPESADELHSVARLFLNEWSKPATQVLGWQMLFEGLTGLRTIEALQLRWDAKKGEPGFIEGGKLTIRRFKKGILPTIQIHAGLRELLDTMAEWRKVYSPDSPWYFPGRNPAQHVGKSVLSKALLAKQAKIGRKLTSHGMRAFYVLVRRSNGVTDLKISFELGQKTGGAVVVSTYGLCPENWTDDNLPKLSWLPKGAPAWEPALSEPIPTEMQEPASIPATYDI